VAATEGDCKVSEDWKSRRTGYRQFPAESELLSYSTGAILALHWGTLHRTIRTKDALLLAVVIAVAPALAQVLPAPILTPSVVLSLPSSTPIWAGRLSQVPIPSLSTALLASTTCK
jgi:hypothetical protein